jgi:hypothetical protein
MSKRPKAEAVAAPVAEPVAGDAPVSIAPPDIPAGNPIDWTVEQWLAANGVAMDKLRADLAAAAARNGIAGITAGAALSIWNAHVGPAQLASAFAQVAVGLASTVQKGRGPSGHAGAELA